MKECAMILSTFYTHIHLHSTYARRQSLVKCSEGESFRISDESPNRIARYRRYPEFFVQKISYRVRQRQYYTQVLHGKKIC